MPTVIAPEVVVITFSPTVIGILFTACIVPSVSVIAVTLLRTGISLVASTVKTSLAVTVKVASFAVIVVFAQVVGKLVFTPSSVIFASCESVLSCSNV